MSVRKKTERIARVASEAKGTLEPGSASEAKGASELGSASGAKGTSEPGSASEAKGAPEPGSAPEAKGTPEPGRIPGLRRVSKEKRVPASKKTRKPKKASVSRGRRRQRKTAALFLLPGLAGVTVFVLAPFCSVTLSSFRTSLTKQFVGFRNYLSVFQNSAFRLAAGNTARFIAMGVPLLLLISLGLALVINSRAKWDKYKYLYLLPMAVPAATMVLVWKLLFERQGFLNRLLETHIDFMGERSAFYIVVGSYLWKNLGYTLVLWLAGLKSVPGDILDAARVDGAGSVVCFLRVTLPNLKGSMYTILVVSLLNSFKVFREVYLVGGAYPQENIYLLQHIFNNWYTNLDFDKMAAGAVLSVLVLGGISLLLQRLWDRDD